MGLSLEAHPSPFRDHVIFSVPGERGDSACVRIFDVSGRRVVDFGKTRLPYALMWLSAGTPPGIYFCVVEDGRGRAFQKVVKLH